MPIGVAGAVALGSAALGAGATIYASSKASKAAKSANVQQAEALEQSNEMTLPYREAGANALAQQTDLLGQNGQEAADKAIEQYRTSPGYEWQLNEGLRAIDAGAASRGMLTSGQTIKAEMKYGQGLADQDFGQYYQRLNQLSTMGQNSAVGAGTNTINTAGQMAQTGVSNATTQGNLATGLASGLSTAANQYASNSAYDGRTNALAGGGNMNNGSFNVSGAGQGAAAGQTYNPAWITR